MKNTQHVLARLSLAAAALVAAATVQAQSGPYGLSTDWSLYGAGKSYIGLNVGESDFSSLGHSTGLFASEKRDTAYSVNVGSYFNNNFGVEAGYTDFGKVNRAGGRTKAEGINLSLVGRLPLGTSFNLLGKLGTTYGRTSVSSALGSGIGAGSENGWGVSYGVGAEYVFNPQLSAVLQWDEHDLKFVGSGRERISATTVGVRLRF